MQPLLKLYERRILSENQSNLALEGLRLVIENCGTYHKAMRTTGFDETQMKNILRHVEKMPFSWINPLMAFAKGDISVYEIKEFHALIEKKIEKDSLKNNDISKRLKRKYNKHRVIKQIKTGKIFLLHPDYDLPNDCQRISKVGDKNCYMDRELKFEFWDIPLYRPVR